MKNISDRQGMTMIAILLSVLIISFMCYFALKTLPNTMGKSNKTFFEGAGVDTSSYKGILDSTNKILKDAVATRNYIP